MPALLEVRLPDGTLILRSPLLAACGFDHAFSTAVGPDDTVFDLSSPGHSPRDTPPETLQSAIDRFVATVAAGTTIATTRQVHGDAVTTADRASDAEADAIASHDPTRLVAVRTADCVPILLGCRRRGVVAAIHAGWRGLVNDVLAAAVRHLVDDGADPADLVAAIGPAIGVEAFEIGPEVAEAFRAAGLASAIHDRTPRPHADLHAAARARLLNAGLSENAIDGSPVCTASDRRFFSHRRDDGRTGRHLSAIRCWRRPG